MAQLISTDAGRARIRVKPQTGAFVPWLLPPVSQEDTGLAVIAMGARVSMDVVRELPQMGCYALMPNDVDHDGMSHERRYGRKCFRMDHIAVEMCKLNASLGTREEFYMFNHNNELAAPWPAPLQGDFVLALVAPTPQDPCRWVLADTKTGMVSDPMTGKLYSWGDIGYMGCGCSFVVRTDQKRNGAAL